MNLKLRQAKLIIVAGKGGSSKSTNASSLATIYAEKGKRVLLASTDPAHNLSDIFEKQIGNKIISITKNLDVIELDVDAIIERTQKNFKQIMDDVLGGIIDKDFVNQIPLTIFRGSGELFVYDTIRKYLRKGYDYVIVDTPPTAYMVQLLSLINCLPRTLLKMVGIYNILRHPLETIKSFFTSAPTKHDIFAKLINDTRVTAQHITNMLQSGNTEVILSVTPETLSLLEDKRLNDILESFGMSVGRIIVSKITPKTDNHCPYCERRYEYEQKTIELIKKAFCEHKIILVPLFPHEITGLRNLEKYGVYLQS